MTLPQMVLAVIVGNALTASALYCVWLSKKDPESRKGYWIAMALCVALGLIAYAARQ